MSSNPKPALRATDLAAAITLADRQQTLGDHGAAAALYRLVLSHIPTYVDARAKLARALFCLQEWDEAWPAFDVRFSLMAGPPKVTARNRDGSPRPLARHTQGPLPRKLLVMSEQGMGDTIQFCRFLPRLVQAGVDLQVVAPQRLFGLLRTLDPSPALLPSEIPGAVSQVEAWTTMMDLPHALGLQTPDYGAPEPYLRADPQRVARWRETLGGQDGPLIGIVWRGNPEHKGDAERSGKLTDLAPLAAIPGVRLVCLQYDATEDEIAACGFAEKIIRPGPDFDAGPDAFVDSAAILTLLDRLVCVDTSLGHLAGALHCPVELLLAQDWADWRWLDLAQTNIWYPKTRLWRRAKTQAHSEPWADVVERIAAAIVSERAKPLAKARSSA